MPRGRPKGSKNKTNGQGGSTPEVIDHSKNSTPLTDEQQHVLLDQSARAYAKALDEKKASDAHFKNTCKTIKGDGVKLQDVKDYLAAETPEGQAKMRERVEAMARIARWRNFPIGTQAELFPEGMTPTMSFTAGKEAGLAGLSAKAPSTANTEEWLKGWQSGQAQLASSFKPIGGDEEAGEDLRPQFLRDRHADAEEGAPNEF